MKAATERSSSPGEEDAMADATVQNVELRIRAKDWVFGQSPEEASGETIPFRRKIVQSDNDMTISRSCRYRLSVPVMFWTTVFFILLLARGVHCGPDDHARFSRSPKYDQGVDAQGKIITPSIQETYSAIQFLLEWIQRQQQRAKEQPQVDGNGEDLSGNQIDWRKIPLPILSRIRAILREQGSREDKRGSYMSLCHFKICNLG